MSHKNNHPSIAVEVQNLSKRFGKQSVIDDVSFRVEPGEIFVLMGPSGAGKSVLLRHLVNLEKPDRGQVLIHGQDASLEATHRKIRSALVFQGGALFNSMSVFDNLAFYPREHRLMSRKALGEKVERVLKILNIADTADRFPAQLSGGMRKRVAIARALVMEPAVLLYDEPTSELDPTTAANIAEVIGTLKEEFAVTSIVVSHDRDLALGIADRVGLLIGGKLVALAPPQELDQSTDPIVAGFMHPKIDIHSPRFRKIG